MSRFVRAMDTADAVAAFFRGRGEVLGHCRTLDWGATAVGVPDDWPATLRVAALMVLGSSAPAAIVWGGERTLVYNDAFVPFVGDAHPAALGQSAHEVWPALRAEHHALFERVLAGETVELLTSHLLRGSRSGGAAADVRATQLSLSPIATDDGTICGVLVATITHALPEGEAKALRVAAEASDARYRRLFEATPQPVFLVDRKSLRLLDANAAAIERYGFPRDELLRLTLRDLRFPEDLPALDAAVARGAFTEGFRAEARHLTRSAEVFDAECRVRALDCDPEAPLLLVVSDVTGQRRAAAQRDFLVEASTLLASSLDYRTTLRHIVSMAVPALADWAAFYLRDGDVLRAEAMHHGDSARTDFALDITRRYPTPADAADAVAVAIRTGTSQLVSDVTDDVLRAAAHDDEHLALLRCLELRSTISVPLLARGAVAGALSFATGESGRRFTRGDLAFAEDLARLAALALDGARLFEAERFARAFSERLQIVTSALSEAVTPTQVVEIVVGEGLGALQAISGAVSLLDESESSLVLVHAVGVSDSRREHLQRLPLELRTALTDAVRTRSPVWIESLAEAARVYPDSSLPMSGPGVRSWAALPLVVDGTVRGALGLAFSHAEGFDDDSRQFMIALARQCAQALDRARLFEAEQAARRTAAAQQRRAEFLSSASETLAASLDYETTLAAIARMCVPELADWCTVDMREEEPGAAWPPPVRRVAAMHRDPEKIPWVKSLVEILPPNWDVPFGLPRVLREGVTEFYPVITDDMLAQASRYAPMHSFLREIGYHAYLCVPLIVRGAVVGAITLCMTESGRTYTDADRTLAEELARRSALAIEHAELYREVQTANAAKAQFLATMSHELRTPLNAIGGYAELMALEIRGPITAEQREDLARIQRSQRHLLGLINEVLNYARLESGALQYQFSDVGVAEAIASAEALVAPQCQAKRLTCVVQGIDPRATIRADGEKVQQILLNLLGNAVKFTSPGGHIGVTCRVDGASVAIAISDNGIGIEAGKLSSIFEPFVQVNVALARTQEGVGLGLSISRDLARAMGGDVTAESEPNAGSTFTLTLPRGPDLSAPASR